MPEPVRELVNLRSTAAETFPATAVALAVTRPRTGFFSTEYSGDSSSSSPEYAAARESAGNLAASVSKEPELPWFRINWEIKALLPIACVLLGGMLLFLLATLSWRDPERHIVLLVAGAGAVAICGALLVVL